MGHLDVLNMVARSFQVNDSINFQKIDPILRKLVEGSKMEKATGNFFEEEITYRAGTTGVEIGDSASQLVPRSADDITSLTGVSPVYLAFDIVLTAPEMDKMRGQDQRIFNLVKKRKDAAMLGAMQDLMAWFISGTSTGKVFADAQLKNLITLDGGHSAGTKTGNTNGLFDYVAPASQSDVVYNQAKSLSGEHYNQFNDTTSFASSGLATLRRTQQECFFNDDRFGKGCDLIAMSPEALLNVQATAYGNVQVMRQSEGGTDLSETGIYRMDLNGAQIFGSPFITPSNYSTAVAQDGIAIHLNTRYLKYLSLRQQSVIIDGINGEFKADGGRQRLFYLPCDIHGQFYLPNLKAHGVTTGLESA